MKKIRIAVIGLHIEVMQASPLQTDASALKSYSPGDMMRDDVWLVRGIIERLSEDSSVEIVPLRWVYALPGGPLAVAAYDEVKSDILLRMKAAGPFDGVAIANHGALEVAGLDIDADTDFVGAIRTLIGPDVPIGIALDLHGDMTPDLLKAVTVISVLRTAPHRDDRETGRRVADQLLRVIGTGIRPQKAAVRIPILAPGEIAMTTFSPARELYGSLPSFDARPGIMEANIMVGFAWNDLPWTGMNVIAVSESSADDARAAALELAGDVWSRRHEFRLGMETAEVSEGLLRAAEAGQRPVFVSDAGDNTTAGASGDLTLVLQAALRDRRVRNVVIAGITAPQTVRLLTDAGVGAEVEITLGAEHLSRPASDVRVNARILALGDGLQLAVAHPRTGRDEGWAVVRIGDIVATFHAVPVGIIAPEHLAAMGIGLSDYDVFVVKLGYLSPEFEDVAQRHILLLSDGVSQLDMMRLARSPLNRPIFPVDGDFEWTPAAGLYGD